MPDNTYGEQLGLSMIPQALGGIMGLALGDINDKRQLKQQEKLQALQIAGQKDMTNYNYGKQLEMWKATNYKAQMEQLKMAGLNPGLLYGMGGGGGQSTGSGSGASVTGANAPTGGREVQDMMGMGIQYRLLQAQKENIEADTANKKAIATKTSGPDTANVQADTENKILQAVITKYTGKEAQDTYERVTSPNRGIQAKTHQDELEAKQAIATTIYEMWVEGKLKEKSLAEVEQLTLQNAKTESEITNIKKTFEILEQTLKGAKLDNIMKDLEMKLQTETGVDKSSGGLLKILGRLFIKLTER